MRVTVLAAAWVALLAGVTPTLGAATYKDPAGDVKRGTGPDLVSISVSNTQKAITFRVRFATAPPLAISPKGKWVDMLLFVADVPPRSMRTLPSGEVAGSDFAFGVHGPEKSGRLAKGKTVASFPVKRCGRTLSFTIALRHFGDPAWVELIAFAARETTDESETGSGYDRAPNKGVYRYTLAG